MNFIFRLDSSNSIGSGHAYRCLKLANTLNENDHKVAFVSQDLKGNNNLLINKNFKLYILKKKNFHTKVKKHYYQWEKGVQENDAYNTLKYIKKYKAKFVIVDHYALSHYWHKIISKHAKLIIIDDFLNKKIYSDLYINYHLIQKKKLKLTNILNSKCKILLGPEYALLNKIKYKKTKNLSKRNILIYFGNVDKAGMTNKIVKLLNKIENHYKFFVIIGKNNKNKKKILILGKNNKNISFVTKSYKDLNNFYANCNSAITGAGVSLYELIQFNRNIISIYSNNYQKKLTSNLEKKNVCKVISYKKITPKNLKEFISTDKKNKIINRKYFDGHGPTRIYRFIKKLNKKY